jgi:hypothetical protein
MSANAATTVVPSRPRTPTAVRAPILSAAPLLVETARTIAAGLLVALLGGLLLAVDGSYYWRDDTQLYHLAGYLEAARAWQEGEWPLLSQTTWQGGALAAEYLNGVFSLFLQGCGLIVVNLGLSLPAAAATFALIHLAVLAMGAYRLARLRELPVDLAFLVALLASLNGYILIWGTLWLPALTSFAWVPWAWWALERTAGPQPGGSLVAASRSLSRFVLPGIFIYLVISAGWPFSVLMLAVVSGWIMVRPSADGRGLWTRWPVPLAWVVGLGLSAPAWLMLLEYTRATARGQIPLAHVAYGWQVPVSGLPGLLFPAWITSWSLFDGWKPHLSAELAGGLVPIVVVLALIWRGGWAPLRPYRWEAGLAAVVLLLAIYPGFGTFRWSFRWLPLFFLVLAVVAAHGLAALRRLPAEAAPNLGLLALALTVPCWLAALAVGGDPTATTWHYGWFVSGACLVWAALERFSSPVCRARVWMPVIFVWLTQGWLFAQVPPFLEAQTWQATVNAPLEAERRYFSVHTWQDVVRDDSQAVIHPRRGIGASLYPGNFGMYHGVSFLNGYSPLQPLGLTQLFDFEIHGTLAPADAERLLTNDAGPEGLLALFGVDGLLVADRFQASQPALLENGWQPAATVPGGTVYHREMGARPSVFPCVGAHWTSDRSLITALLAQRGSEPAPLLVCAPDAPPTLTEGTFAAAAVASVRTSRNAVTAAVSNPDTQHEALVAVARPWFPGYRARLNGQTLPVETLNLVLPVVRIPPQTSGALVVEYWPRSLALGLWVAALTGVAALAACGLARHRHHDAASGAHAQKG